MEEITIQSNSKEEQYQELLPQIKSLVGDEPNRIANMANIAASLKQTFAHYSWAGFYLYDTQRKELVLGPFQGKVACTRIPKGKGVCGSAFDKEETIIVPDVNKFPGHIFCDGDSLSEIVIPLFFNGRCFGVFDVDSHRLNSFDAVDKSYLEQLMNHVAPRIGE